MESLNYVKTKEIPLLHNFMERRGAMNQKEMNDYYVYSSLYDGETIPRTFYLGSEIFSIN